MPARQREVHLLVPFPALLHDAQTGAFCLQGIPERKDRFAGPDPAGAFLQRQGLISKAKVDGGVRSGLLGQGGNLYGEGPAVCVRTGNLIIKDLEHGVLRPELVHQAHIMLVDPVREVARIAVDRVFQLRDPGLQMVGPDRKAQHAGHGRQEQDHLTQFRGRCDWPALLEGLIDPRLVPGVVDPVGEPGYAQQKDKDSEHLCFVRAETHVKTSFSCNHYIPKNSLNPL